MKKRKDRFQLENKEDNVVTKIKIGRKKIKKKFVKTVIKKNFGKKRINIGSRQDKRNNKIKSGRNNIRRNKNYNRKNKN